eukprot:8870284-Alexandrium_andersonii.AAC.1
MLIFPVIPQASNGGVMLALRCVLRSLGVESATARGSAQMLRACVMRCGVVVARRLGMEMASRGWCGRTGWFWVVE